MVAKPKTKRIPTRSDSLTGIVEEWSTEIIFPSTSPTFQFKPSTSLILYGHLASSSTIFVMSITTNMVEAKNWGGDLALSSSEARASVFVPKDDFGTLLELASAGMIRVCDFDFEKKGRKGQLTSLVFSSGKRAVPATVSIGPRTIDYEELRRVTARRKQH